MRQVKRVKIGQVASSDQNNKKVKKENLESLLHTPRHDMDIDKFSRKQKKDMLTKMVKKKNKKRNMFFRLFKNFVCSHEGKGEK